MTTRLIDCGLYRETLRRLRTPALVMLILSLTEAVPFVLNWMIGYTSDRLVEFHEIHPLQYAIPFVAPFLLTLIAFHFQTKRCDSDFYHALPYTRTTLSVSILGAVLTWCAAITLLSAALMSVVALPFRCEFTFADVAFETAASFTASLLMLALTYLTVTMCGNSVSSVFAVFILLFAPLILASSLVSTLVDNLPILTYFDTLESFTKYNLLYSYYHETSAWVGTAVGIVACFALGFIINKFRPSETAGNATAHPAMQITLRLLLTLVCCLPAIVMLINGSSFDLPSVVFIYVLALIAYFLYELFTTKKLKNLVKAIPWLAVLAILNVLCILGVNVGQRYALSVQPSAEDTAWVSLTAINNYDQVKEHGEAKWSIYYNVGDTSGMLATDEPILPDTYGDFYDFSERYNESDCTQVRLTDDTSKSIVCQRLQTACEILEEKGFFSWDDKLKDGVNKEWQCYNVEVAIHTGGVTYHRVIWLYDSELLHLFNMIEEQVRIPRLYDNNDVYPNI